ncbi:MAG TPA: carbamate kinase [Gemmatimonadales bacterium]|nr:carbamate kinase [Gemmatimonadales bacterium]
MTKQSTAEPSRTVVVALGGNALAPESSASSITAQFRHSRASVLPLIQFAQEGWHIALVHGNGPQVGDELVRQELARHVAEPLPLGVLVAGTAGWLGYMLQQVIQNQLEKVGIVREVVTLITQTIVDPSDPLLARPTKPIGHALSKEDAEALQRNGVAVGKDGAGHWRRLASSPRPLSVVEAPLVKRLVEAGVIVIAAGGGGPAVYHHPVTGYEGLDVVVDKDRVATVLATELGAEVLLILTDVDAVYRNWKTPEAEPIHGMSLAEAEAMLEDGSLGEGGMRPKVEAAVGFVRARGVGARAIIAHLAHGSEALRGETGTIIQRES